MSAVASLLCLLSLTGLPSCENQHDLSKSCPIPCCPPIILECRPSSSLNSFSGFPLCLQHRSCTFCCQKESFLPPHLIHGCLLHIMMLTALLGQGQAFEVITMQEDLQGSTHPIACAHPLLKRAGFPANEVLQTWICDCQGWVVQRLPVLHRSLQMNQPLHCENSPAAL